MNRKEGCSLIILLFPLLAFTQSVSSTACHRVRNGTFYFYPTGNPKGFTVIRRGAVQTEIDHSTGDTTFWNVNWKSACILELKFIRKSRSLSSDDDDFFKSHIAVVEVLRSEKKYYLFNGGLDSISNTKFVNDTMWLKPKL